LPLLADQAMATSAQPIRPTLIRQRGECEDCQSYGGANEHTNHRCLLDD
jgi:hypothetical protein